MNKISGPYTPPQVGKQENNNAQSESNENKLPRSKDYEGGNMLTKQEGGLFNKLKIQNIKPQQNSNSESVNLDNHPVRDINAVHNQIENKFKKEVTPSQVNRTEVKSDLTNQTLAESVESLSENMEVNSKTIPSKCITLELLKPKSFFEHVKRFFVGVSVVTDSGAVRLFPRHIRQLQKQVDEKLKKVEEGLTELINKTKDTIDGLLIPNSQEEVKTNVTIDVKNLEEGILKIQEQLKSLEENGLLKISDRKKISELKSDLTENLKRLQTLAQNTLSAMTEQQFENLKDQEGSYKTLEGYLARANGILKNLKAESDRLVKYENDNDYDKRNLNRFYNAVLQKIDALTRSEGKNSIQDQLSHKNLAELLNDKNLNALLKLILERFVEEKLVALTEQISNGSHNLNELNNICEQLNPLFEAVGENGVIKPLIAKFNQAVLSKVLSSNELLPKTSELKLNDGVSGEFYKARDRLDTKLNMLSQYSKLNAIARDSVIKEGVEDLKQKLDKEMPAPPEFSSLDNFIKSADEYVSKLIELGSAIDRLENNFIRFQLFEWYSEKYNAVLEQMGNVAQEVDKQIPQTPQLPSSLFGESKEPIKPISNRMDEIISNITNNKEDSFQKNNKILQQLVDGFKSGLEDLKNDIKNSGDVTGVNEFYQALGVKEQVRFEALNIDSDVKHVSSDQVSEIKQKQNITSDFDVNSLYDVLDAQRKHQDAFYNSANISFRVLEEFALTTQEVVKARGNKNELIKLQERYSKWVREMTAYLEKNSQQKGFVAKIDSFAFLIKVKIDLNGLDKKKNEAEAFYQKQLEVKKGIFEWSGFNLFGVNVSEEIKNLYAPIKDVSKTSSLSLSELNEIRSLQQRWLADAYKILQQDLKDIYSQDEKALKKALDKFNKFVEIFKNEINELGIDQYKIPKEN